MQPVLERSVPRRRRSRWLVPAVALPLAAVAGWWALDRPTGDSFEPPVIVVVPPPSAAGFVLPMPPLVAEAIAAARAPFELTASDGSGLVLSRVDARGTVEGRLAFTELHLYFRNPETRVREGTFSITLPPSASVARFAMEIDGAWQDAEVVERSLARQVYETYLHRGQDPALLEQATGNTLSARVFPIPANADKHLIVSFAQELRDPAYVLPLRGLPEVGAVNVAIDVLGGDGTRSTRTLAMKAWKPDRDFAIDVPAGEASVGSGDLVVATVVASAPPATPAPAPPRNVTLLVDTSGSRAAGFAAYAAQVRALVGELRERYGDPIELQLVAFDQEAEQLYRGPAAAFGDVQERALASRGGAGASDLCRAFEWLGRHGSERHVVAITDAAVTAGAAGPMLTAALAKLGPVVARLDVVLAGAARDERTAGSLVRVLAEPGAVLDLDRGIADVAIGLGQRVLADVTIDIAGATWIHPRTVRSVRAGAAITVHARLAAPAPRIAVSVGGLGRELAVVAASPALVEHAVAAAEIDELEQRLAGVAVPSAVLEPGVATAARTADELRAAIAKRGVAARIVTSQTSMLVLESDAEYARFGIDRASLAGVLAIGARGVERRVRPPPKVVVEEPRRDIAPTGNPPRMRLQRTDEEWVPAEHAAPVRRLRPRSLKLYRAPMEYVGTPVPAVRERMHSVDLSVPDYPDPAGAPPAGPVGVPDDGDRAAPGSSDRARHSAPPVATRIGGHLGEVRALIAKGGHANLARALTIAQRRHSDLPTDLLGLVALGEAFTALDRPVAAARAYGSIIDLYPHRAELRRFAGELLETVDSSGGGRRLAIDTYRRALADRPDQPSGYRLLAYALLLDGKYEDALAIILAGVDLELPSGRYAGVARVLRDDARIIAAVYLARGGAPTRVAAELGHRGMASAASSPSTRFVLTWETDANDVDLHVQDARGGHAYYASPELASGGVLYADVTTGFGPECFAIAGAPTAGPYMLGVTYFSRGAMGYGLGRVTVLTHDGAGTVSVEHRPFVLEHDHAMIDLGTWSPQ